MTRRTPMKNVKVLPFSMLSLSNPCYPRHPRSKFSGSQCSRNSTRGKTWLHPALGFGFLVARASAQQTCEILINRGRIHGPRQILRRIETRENGADDLASRHTFFAIARWNVARPETDVIDPEFFLHAQIDNGVSTFAPADFGRPKNLHEIARLCCREIVKILSQVHFME